MSRFDVLKSLVRGAAKAGAERVQKLRPVANVRLAMAELRARRATLTEGALSSAIAQGVRGVTAATVSLTEGRIIADVGLEDGETLVLAIIPEQARFAPRGAKEIVFSVEPPAAVDDGRFRTQPTSQMTALHIAVSRARPMATRKSTAR